MAPVLTRRQRVSAVVLFVVFMAAAAVAPFALVAALHAGGTAADAKRDSRVNAAVAAKGQDFASTAAKACQTTAGRAQLQRLGISCAQASQVATTPPTGAAGPQGIPGVPGVQGPVGSVGAQGAKGDPGSVGPRGVNGSPGANGQSGANGQAGSDGPPGPEGSTGPAGSQGDAGPPGVKGDTGPAGPDECTQAGGTWITQNPGLPGGNPALVCELPPSGGN